MPFLFLKNMRSLLSLVFTNVKIPQFAASIEIGENDARSECPAARRTLGEELEGSDLTRTRWVQSFSPCLGSSPSQLSAFLVAFLSRSLLPVRLIF
uniref:Uncharacterized protein n=1 Tax=Rhizophora mucronata TaxID=61149 RepID=A0A2P2KVL8_RHIMU